MIAFVSIQIWPHFQPQFQPETEIGYFAQELAVPAQISNHHLDGTMIEPRLIKMKQFAAGLSFICFYFLLPTGAEAATFGRAHDTHAASDVVLKPVSCLMIRADDCCRRIVMGDSLSSQAWVHPAILDFVKLVDLIPATVADSAAYASRKHVLHTGLSPPFFA